MGNENAPNNSGKYKGLDAAGIKKGSPGEATQDCPAGAYDKSGGQGKEKGKGKS